MLRNPDLINQIIQETDDGHVIVRLFEPRNESGHCYYSPVYYQLDKTELKNPVVNFHGAPWVHLLEKAYFLHRVRLDPAQYESKIGFFSFRNVLGQGSSHKVYEHVLGVKSFC